MEAYLTNAVNAALDNCDYVTACFLCERLVAHVKGEEMLAGSHTFSTLQCVRMYNMVCKVHRVCVCSMHCIVDREVYDDLKRSGADVYRHNAYVSALFNHRRNIRTHAHVRVLQYTRLTIRASNA